MGFLLSGVFVGIIFGLGIGYLIGNYNGKCEHRFEEVANVISGNHGTVVHMCKKCGKRKITKV
jgi:hypothetical protein